MEVSAAKRTAQELLDTAAEDSRRRYAGKLRFDYRLPTEALWQVRTMWHEQRFSNLLCTLPRRGSLSGFPGPR